MKLNSDELKKIINEIEYINNNLNTKDKMDDYLNKTNINDISSLLKFLDYEYHNNAKNLITDFWYDYIYCYYEKFTNIKQTKLDRVYTNECLNKKLIKFDDNLIITPKLDGLSVTLQKIFFKKNFKLTLKSKTENNNYTKILDGIDINLTKTLKFINKNKLSSFVACGELIIPKDKIIKSPGRSEVNGLIKRKKYEKDSLKNITIVFYKLYLLDVNNNEIVIFQNEQLKILKKLSLNIPKYIELKKDEVDINKIKTLFEDVPYELDGFIIKELTNNAKELAYKFSSDKYSVIIKNVEWVLKSNKYTPILIIDPILICNVTISRITCHNANKLTSQKIGIGAVIEIEYTGMTIPTIKTVLKESEDYNFPKQYKWDSNKINIIPLVTCKMNSLQIEKFMKLYNMKDLHISSSKLDKIFNYCVENNINIDYNDDNIIYWIDLIEKVIQREIKLKNKFFGELTDKVILKFCNEYKTLKLDFLLFLAWIPCNADNNISYNTILDYNSKFKLKKLINYNKIKISQILKEHKITQMKIDIIIYKIKKFRDYYANELKINY